MTALQVAEPRRARAAPRPTRVLLVQRILPHYRVRLFQTLARTESLAYHFAYGQHRAAAVLESVQNPDGLTVAPLRNAYLTAAGKELAVYQRGLSALLKSGAYDVVIAEFNPRIVSNVLACVQSRRAGVKFIWWGHGAGPNAGAATVRARVALARAADAVIFYDEVQAGRFVSRGVPGEQVFVAPNSIDIDAITRHASTPGSGGERGARDRVVYVGRLVAEKKVDLLIRAFALARGRFASPQRLTVVGDGPERPVLEALAAALGVAPDVEFTGALYAPEELAPFFNRAWASASPGGVGLAAVHSLAFGVPVVMAQGEPHGPEASALEDGRNAVFFPAGQADALAAALVALERDRERWLAMAWAARDTAEQRFGLDRMAAAFTQAVRHVCAL